MTSKRDFRIQVFVADLREISTLEQPCQLPLNVSNETNNCMPAQSVSIEIYSGIARFPCDVHGSLALET